MISFFILESDFLSFMFFYLLVKKLDLIIPENVADIIFPNLQESMRSNNQRAAIINHQKHK